MAGKSRSGWGIDLKGQAELVKQFAEVAPVQAEKLAVQTLNRAVQRGRSSFVRLATQQYTWRSSYVRERTNTTQASISQAQPNARIVVPVRETLLSRFNVKQAYTGGRGKGGGKRKPGGLLVQVRRDRAPVLLKSAFFVRNLRGSGVLGTASRIGKGRLPIEVQRSVSVHSVLRYNAPTLGDEASNFIRSELARRVANSVLGK